MNAADFAAALREHRASAILRTHDNAAARRAMNAAVAGGFRVVEFTLSIPGAVELIAEFARHEGLIVGAGTVLTPDEAQACVAAGAQYLVSPVVDLEVIAAANQLQTAIMPGCATPTEMLAAHRAGAAAEKLFPGAGITPAWVKQVLGPLPFLKIVPTSGVTLDNAVAYLHAGSWGVGFVNSLFEPADLAHGRFDRIESRAKEMVQTVRDA